METLAPELLDLIIEFYGDEYEALTLLMRCSKALCSRLQPVLYGSQTRLDRAMRRACKTGNVHTLRVAISYGANISTIGLVFPCSTFMLAAERGHVEAFNFLIKIGAKLDSNFKISPRLARSLCLPRNAAVLHSFLDKGFVSLPGAQLSLCSVIRNGGSLDSVRALLDHGSDANCHEQTDEYHIIATPLTTALLANQIPIVDLLIQRGADIHGTENCNPFKRQWPYPFAKPLHLPIFAAATAMARHGCTKILQRCLDLGSDINYVSRTREYDYSWPTYTTPLLTYLDSIECWDPKVALRPVDGLRYFLQHGSSLELSSILVNQPQRGREDANAISTIEVLLDKWGLEMLGDHEFFATIEFLIEHGGGKDRLKEILTKYRESKGNLLTHWTKFAALLTKKHFDPKDPAADHRLLQYIILRSNPYRTFGEMDHVAVLSLLQAGADINAHIDSTGRTILHEICSPRYMIMFGHIRSHTGTAENCHYVREKYSEFSFLRDVGADPRIVADGKTPIDVLLELMGPSDTISESGLCFLVKLGNILLGEVDKYGLSELKDLNISGKGSGIQHSPEGNKSAGDWIPCQGWSQDRA
ncbi:hypothetical protein VTL71DRAFT_4899 [Oculimacula yallundae]|uniref:Ankyrin n=1 Tax=Oculimacula yallundae TaxID=86028 RepID=A0ABR4C421_9HELO